MTKSIQKIVPRLFGIAMLASLSLSTASAFQGPPQMPPAHVEVTTAEEHMMAPQMDVTGTVISLQDSRISVEVEGPLQWIAEVGTAVEKGDIIARMDNRLLALALRQAEANLKRLQADMVFRNQEVKRFEDLSARNNASKARLEETIAQREMLHHEIQNAQALVERARGDVERANIRAPFPGHVVTRLANIGEYLIVGEEVIRLVNTRNLEISLPAPISITPYLHNGDKISVLDDRGIHQLPIKRIVPVGDMVSRMVQVLLSPGEEPWIVGTPVKVSLPKGTPKRAVAVPRDALIYKAGSVYVYKVGPDMSAEQIKVEIDAAVGLLVSLKKGLQAGDKVIIRGGERLQPGQKVVIKSST
tara:strand:+ start:485 stop:1561 length:1077 start_codon:yes stop_codon:yes gene_type:complete